MARLAVLPLTGRACWWETSHGSRLGDKMREISRDLISLRSLSLLFGVVFMATLAQAQEGAPADAAPTEAVAEDAAPTEAAADEAAPAEVAPADSAAEDAAPAETISVKAVIEEGASEASFAGRLAYLEDASGELTIEKIIEGADSVGFKAYEKPDESPNFGLNPSVHWFKVQIENLAETVQWVVEVDYSMLDTITFYAQGADGSYAPQVSGDSEAFEGRYWEHRNPNFKVDIWQGDTAVVYLKVQTAGSLQLPLSIYSERTFGLRSMRDSLNLGLYFGILIIMVLFNGLLFIPTKDTTYLQYVVFLTFFGLFDATLRGLGFAYLWPESPSFNNLFLLPFIFIALWGAVSFSRNYLNAVETSPKLDGFLKIVGVLLVVFTVAAFAAPYKYMIGGVILSVLVVCITLVILGFSSMSSGFPPAKFFLVAWGSFLFGVVLYALKTGGVLPSNALTNSFFQIGSTMLVTLLALGMRARFEFLRSSGLGR